jgi:hypothetical protein
MGMVYHSTGNFGAALKCFEEALEIRQELFGDTHPETVRAVVDCAFTLCRLHRVHRGHELIDVSAHKIPKEHLLFQWFKEQRLSLQKQFPRPGFRQPPRGH